MRARTITRLFLAGTLALITSGGLAAPAAAAPAAPTPPVARAADAGTMTSSVEGTFTDATGAPGKVTGTFTPSSFAVRDGALVATGVLHSVLTSAAGVPVGATDTEVTLPVQVPSSNGVQIQAACPILNLVLGPLDLDLLGLVVHLDRVVLDITAQSGPGNLLGNLLCAITNLLNGGGAGLPLAILAQLLNALLAILGL